MQNSRTDRQEHKEKNKISSERARPGRYNLKEDAEPSHHAGARPYSELDHEKNEPREMDSAGPVRDGSEKNPVGGQPCSTASEAYGDDFSLTGDSDPATGDRSSSTYLEYHGDPEEKRHHDKHKED